MFSTGHASGCHRPAEKNVPQKRTGNRNFFTESQKNSTIDVLTQWQRIPRQRNARVCRIPGKLSFYIPSQDNANFTTASVPERDAEKVKKVKKVVADASGAPVKKRKGME
jgi:hypothetical protein